MEGRIVISFRAVGGPGRPFVERARALDERARADGAVLVGWGGSSVSFAFEPSKLHEAIALVTVGGDDTVAGETAFCVGIAQGSLERLAEDGSSAGLSWGAPLVAASLLAQTAEPGQILCSQSVRALGTGELIAAGHCTARDGTLRVRGARLDAARPWRKQAVEQLSHMRVAPLVGEPLAPLSLEPGSLFVLRADPGTGGTRCLSELASRAPRALVVSPGASMFEPLGALRRALSRSTTRELSPMLLELAGPLEALLAGDGVSLELAARLVAAFLWPKTEGQGPGLLLLDDAKSIDPATLEACVLAASRATAAAFGVVARLDATSGLPSVLAALPKSAEIELAPLSREAAERLAGGATSDALDDVARARWAKLGANVPLAIVEAIALGIVTGEVRWDGDKASPRSRASGRGKVRGAADWIALRARDESAPCRTLLCLVALLGGEARITILTAVLEAAGQTLDVDAALEELMRGRWLVDTQEDWVAFPSRTHREALAGLLDAEKLKALHLAASSTFLADEGTFGRVEAAWHAAQSGDGPRAARILLESARATAAARLEASTTQLIAFARRADPSCEEVALELLSNALERAPSVPPPNSRSGPPAGLLPSLPLAPPPVPRGAGGPLPLPPPPRRGALANTGAHAPAVDAAARPSRVAALPDDVAPIVIDTSHDSEPPTIARVDLPPMAPHDILRSVEPEQEPADPVASGVDIASRLGELAKDALLSADNAALERWVNGLRAAGESPQLTERLRALSRLGRGDIGDALRVLRRTRSELDPKDHILRCQTSLALGVALSVAGRPQEALLEGMDALARARQVDDDRGAHACLAFLAKLYTSVGRVEADRLRVTADS